MGNELLTLSKLAEYLNIDLSQLLRESKRPHFPCHLVEGEPRFDPAEVTAWRRRSIRPRARWTKRTPTNWRI